MKHVLSIDPGKSSGVSFFYFTPRGYRLKYAEICSPATTDVVQESLRYALNVSQGNLCVVIEEQRGGIMGMQTFALLVRSRERWQCLSEAAGLKVRTVAPSTWHSFCFNRKRVEDTKAESIKRVFDRYSNCEFVNVEDPRIENVCDSINIGEYFITNAFGQSIIQSADNVGCTIRQPKFPVRVTAYVRTKRGTISAGGTRTYFIVRATKTKLFVFDSDLEFRRTPLSNLKIGFARNGAYQFKIHSEDLENFENKIDCADEWP